MNAEPEKKELVFLEELRQYENQWVAIAETADSEKVVGSGTDAIEAMQDAETRGFKAITLFFVRRSDVGYMPLTAK